MLPARTTRFVIGALVAMVGALACPPPSWAWSWPVDGDVLQGFHVSADKYAAGQHRGIDIAFGDDARKGGAGPVRAPVAGDVTFAGAVPTHGLTITIATADGHRASLTHLGQLVVERGARVAEGDPVAAGGPSGDPEHDVGYVHLGIRVGDGESYVDPLALLPPRAAPTPPPAPAAPPAPVPAEAAPSPPVVASPEPPSQVASPPPAAEAEPELRPGPEPAAAPVAEPARPAVTAGSAGAIVAAVARRAEGVQASGSRRPGGSRGSAP